MSTVLRLALVSHANTEAMRLHRFPVDEPVDDIGRRDIAKAEQLTAERAVIAPERRAVETAEGLGVAGLIDDALADLDAGRWRGLAMDALPPDELAGWLQDPAFDGHGGESVLALLNRVAGWMRAATEFSVPTIAVTHPAIVRAAIVAALAAPPEAFWRIDIAPLSVTRLHYRGAWSLRSITRS